MKSKVMRTIVDFLIIIVAGIIFACGLESFVSPNNIAPGGVSGISVALSYLTGLNEGIFYLGLNIPLLILGFIFLGKKLIGKTLISVVTVTLAVDFIFANLPHYEGDRILAAIFGGLLMGTGLGLTYSREATSGGSDIVNKLINKKLQSASLGVITFITDCIVIGASMLVFREIEAGLYAIIAIFISSRVMDVIIYGGMEGKMLLVFSDKHEEIAKKFIENGRGVTFLDAEGGFSGKATKVICCAVRKNEYAKFRRFVKEIDSSSFMIIASAKEVLGNGFIDLNKQ